MAVKRKNGFGNGRKFTTQQSLDGYVKGICDIMRRSNVAGALQYVPELTWLLFLRIFDERDTREAEYAEAVGAEFGRSHRAALPLAGLGAHRMARSALSYRWVRWGPSSASSTAS